MHTPPTSNFSHQVAILCPSKYTSLHLIFQKFPGEHAPGPPGGAQASPKLLPSVRKLTGA